MTLLLFSVLLSMTLILNFTDITHKAFEKLGYDDKIQQMVISNVPRNVFREALNKAMEVVDKTYTPKIISGDCANYTAMNIFMGKRRPSYSCHREFHPLAIKNVIRDEERLL